MVEEGHLCVTPTLDLFFVEQHVQEIVEFSRYITPLMKAEAVFALVVSLDGHPIHPIVKFWEHGEGFRCWFDPTDMR